MLRKITGQVVKLNVELFNRFISEALQDGNHSKSFWKYIKSNRQLSGIPPLQITDRPLVVDASAKANIFNDYFHSVFNIDDPGVNVPSDDLSTARIDMQGIVITEDIVFNLMKNVKESKAAGPDHLPGVVIKQLSLELTNLVTILFQCVIDQGELPLDWKSANVVPIHKGGKKDDVHNYRPISLTCIFCKLFEQILHASLYAHLNRNQILTSFQHGFRAGFSCETQAVALFNDLALELDKQHEVDIIFLDFSKAFDKVSHGMLMCKLENLKIHPNILSVIRSFLFGRTQRVVLDGELSNSVCVTSGVPQGSVLGPLLFLVFVNDIVNNISSHIRLYADDTVLYRTILDSNDTLHLQQDLEIVARWCSTWGMQLNKKKCVSMTVSNKKKLSLGGIYRLDTYELEKVDRYKYLGVIFDSTLGWVHHVEYVISRANRALGFIKRHLLRCAKDVKLKAYFALVRPHLEYACSVWDPCVQILRDQLEMVQRRAVRFVCGRYGRCDSVTSMMSELSVVDLQTRRTQARLKLFYKHHNEMLGWDTTPNLAVKDLQRRTDNGMAYNRLPARTNCYFYSFFPRTVRDWNALDNEVVSSASLKKFVEKLEINI
jgi:hypothetical protein